MPGHSANPEEATGARDRTVFDLLLRAREQIGKPDVHEALVRAAWARGRGEGWAERQALLDAAAALLNQAAELGHPDDLPLPAPVG